MKIYIELQNANELEKSIKVCPKKKFGKIQTVNIIAQGQPEIILSKPYMYENEISQMQRHISIQNLQYQKLNDAFDNLWNTLPEEQRKPKEEYFNGGECGKTEFVSDKS